MVTSTFPDSDIIATFHGTYFSNNVSLLISTTIIKAIFFKKTSNLRTISVGFLSSKR